MRVIAAISLLLICTLLWSPADAQERIKLATTTSTENSGLLLELLPPFEKLFGVKVDVIAVGTGKALKLGENGDVDVVLVHARKAEEDFAEKAFGVNRRDVMYNNFVIAGPRDDPAGIAQTSDALSAMKRIFEKNSLFASRADDSGTHKKEMEIWEKAGVDPRLTPNRFNPGSRTGKWYIETGQGMGATLQIADEKGAYVLIDRGTLLAYSRKVDIVVLFEGDSALFNPYGVIAINPSIHPHVNYVYSMALIGWMTSPQGQKIIEDFRVGGQTIFHPYDRKM